MSMIFTRLNDELTAQNVVLAVKERKARDGEW